MAASPSRASFPADPTGRAPAANCWGLDLRAGDKPSIFRSEMGNGGMGQDRREDQAMPNETESSARIHSDTQVELKYISLCTPCFRLCLRFPLEVGSLGSKSRAAQAH